MALTSQIIGYCHIGRPGSDNGDLLARRDGGIASQCTIAFERDLLGDMALD
jgi:hypothetical protein